jgi:hypothetical protein
MCMNAHNFMRPMCCGLYGNWSALRYKHLEMQLYDYNLGHLFVINSTNSTALRKFFILLTG